MGPLPPCVYRASLKSRIQAQFFINCTEMQADESAVDIILSLL